MNIETFGSIIKEEQVKTFERAIVENTLALENLGLFPGYYGAPMPVDSLPDSVFFVMQQKEPTEKVLRLAHNIKKETGVSFEGSPATIAITSGNYEAIRIRGFQNFEQIVQLESAFQKHGIQFIKPRKIDEVALITIKKIFTISKVNEVIFKDTERNMYYLKINDQLTWSDFKKITQQLRHNISLSAFDAALAVVYGNEVMDLIRIYAEKLSLDELTLLHNKYLELIKINI